MIASWDKEKFYNNLKLERIIWTHNHEYINMTSAMVADLTKVQELDLTGNIFICNPSISEFYRYVAVYKIY